MLANRLFDLALVAEQIQIARQDDPCCIMMLSKTNQQPNMGKLIPSDGYWPMEDTMPATLINTIRETVINQISRAVDGELIPFHLYIDPAITTSAEHPVVKELLAIHGKLPLYIANLFFIHVADSHQDWMIDQKRQTVKRTTDIYVATVKALRATGVVRTTDEELVQTGNQIIRAGETVIMEAADDAAE